MTRRWLAGSTHTSAEGLRFRCVKGKKSPDDLRLEVLVAGQWQPVRMALGFMLADFFFENEEFLYPPPARGGYKYLDAARHAARNGYMSAVNTLENEKRQKHLDLTAKPPGLSGDTATHSRTKCAKCDGEGRPYCGLHGWRNQNGVANYPEED